MKVFTSIHDGIDWPKVFEIATDIISRTKLVPLDTVITVLFTFTHAGIGIAHL